MTLSHEDVQEILRLLDETEYDELTLETERFTLYLKQDGDGKGWTQETQTATSHQLPATSTTLIDTSQNSKDPTPTEEGLLDIRAPMVGTFYQSPKPGADPYIDIGSQVKKDTVIGIIEVMKLMNSIPAGLSGELVEILAEDAQFVEKGQLLMRVRPVS
jgi:acetyl-CoA carboxylase biotin carboxyl carrier protein